MTTGPITRTVEDAALVMEVIGGRDDRDFTSLPDTNLKYLDSIHKGIRNLRIAWSKNLGYAKVDPSVAKATENAVKIFESLGGRVEQADPPGFSLLGAYYHIVGVAHAAALKDVVRQHRSSLHPCVPFFVEPNEDLPAAEYGKARIQQAQYWQGIRPFFEKFDLLLTPTVAIPPFRIGERETAVQASYKDLAFDWDNVDDWLPFTYPFNMTGQPAATVPCGLTNDGLPIGLQIVGRRFDETTVLMAAAAFEQASPRLEKESPLLV